MPSIAALAGDILRADFKAMDSTIRDADLAMVICYFSVKYLFEALNRYSTGGVTFRKTPWGLALRIAAYDFR